MSFIIVKLVSGNQVLLHNEHFFKIFCVTKSSESSLYSVGGGAGETDADFSVDSELKELSNTPYYNKLTNFHYRDVNRLNRCLFDFI